MTEDIENYHNVLETYLKNPTQKNYGKLLTKLDRYHSECPPCPKCGKANIHKLGTINRKAGRLQQYRCKRCKHIYTKQSIETKRKMKKYPSCPKCKATVVRRGFWKWTNTNGTVNRVQKYQCTCCKYWFRVQKKRWSKGT